MDSTMIREFSTQRIKNTSDQSNKRDHKKLLKTSKIPTISKLEVIRDQWNNKSSDLSQTLLEKFTLRIMTLRSKLMCKEHGCTQKMQVSEQSTLGQQEKFRSSHLIMLYPYLSEMVCGLNIQRVTNQDSTEEKDKM